jgi:hypothetical protein
MSKTAAELGNILSGMYKSAPKKEQVVMIYLFGIQFPDEILKVGIQEVIQKAGIHSMFKTDLNTAVKLARYVTPLQVDDQPVS